MSGHIKKLAIEDMRKSGISPIYIAFEEINNEIEEEIEEE